MLDANTKLYTVCDTAELLHKALSLTAQGTPCDSVSKSLLRPISFFIFLSLDLPPFLCLSMACSSPNLHASLVMVVES